jgi:hypothetical protein
LAREKEKLIQVIKPFVLSGGNVNKIKANWFFLHSWWR